ncbi:sigma 54-interacting transcriptional regulator [bacterium]|nr:sigma 54-interacting transcriptional regulator [bacterium]
MDSNTFRMEKSSVLPVRDALLRCCSGPECGLEFLIPESTKTTIGTAADNDIVLTDDAVSRHHVELVPQPESFLLLDLGSTNGTFVDGVQVKEAHIKPQVNIRLGRSEFLFVYPEVIRRDTHKPVGELRGSSRHMQHVVDMIRKVSQSPLNVLLTGETGTGKELVARAIHTSGPRYSLPFVVVDCGAIPDNLIESELFGHERGAFTGAVALRKGAFEEAGGGTVLLDEVGEIDFQLQPKLLRVLESRQFKRIGSSKPIGANFRVIAATNRNLKREVKEGHFRQDLYYRLSVLEIALPPLRDRTEDIPELVSHFLLNSSAGANQKQFTESAMNFLREYSWPGNVRQLRNTVERAVLLASQDMIDVQTVAELLPISSSNPRGVSLADIEKKAITNALQKANGNKTEAAKSLGIAYSTLFEKIKKYGLG